MKEPIQRKTYSKGKFFVFEGIPVSATKDYDLALLIFSLNDKR